MSVLEKLKRTDPPGFSLMGMRLHERDVRLATAVAAAFNIAGMPLRLAMMRTIPTAPVWPGLSAMAVSAGILAVLLLGELRGKPDWVRVLFVVNVACISLALFVMDPYLALYTPHWIPFQPSQLGAIVAGMLAPGFWVGIASIAIMIGTPMVQYFTSPSELRVYLDSSAPWALLAYGLASVFVLVHRLRVRQLEAWALEAQAEAESTRRIAKAFLELRDLMNTPLQSVEIAAKLLKDKKSEPKPILDLLQKSCSRLQEISETLKRFEHKIEWERERDGPPAATPEPGPP